MGYAGKDLIAAIRAGNESDIWFELDIAQRGYLLGWPGTLGKIPRDEALTLIQQGQIAVLVALSQHPDGRVREAAILTFQPEDGLTLEALIRRANDWVPVVAKLAADRALRLFPLAADEQLKAILPKVFALTRQHRVDHRPLVNEYLREIARRPRLARKIRRAYGSGSIGRWAFDHVRGHDESAAELAREALRNPQVAVRIAGARQLAKDPSSWSMLMASKNAAVRRIGLDIAPEGVRLAAVVDPHPGVRNDARYLLGKRDYAAHYRAHLPAAGAISGIGETGCRQDATLLEPFLIAPEPDVRRRALEAYARLLEEGAVDELLLAVQDSSGKVRRTAVQWLLRQPVSIDAEQVIDWKLGRAEAWALISRVRPWSALLAVLRRSEDFPSVQEWLVRWADAARRKPIPPHPAEVAVALVLVEESTGLLAESTTRALRQAIEPWLRP